MKNHFPYALAAVDATMQRGRLSHLADDWRAHSPVHHIARARRHLDLFAKGDKSEPHLSHAVARLLMALELGLLAVNNGQHYTPPRRCSRCKMAECLRGQRWCRQCLTAYQRQRRHRAL
jgi:hypothetical protein